MTFLWTGKELIMDTPLNRINSDWPFFQIAVRCTLRSNAWFVRNLYSTVPWATFLSNNMFSCHRSLSILLVLRSGFMHFTFLQRTGSHALNRSTVHEETFAKRMTSPARIDYCRELLLIMNHYIHDQVHWPLHFHVSWRRMIFLHLDFFLSHDVSTTLQKPSQKWNNVQINLSINKNKWDVLRINPALFWRFAMLPCSCRVLVACGTTEECLVQQNKHSVIVKGSQTLWINK